MNKLLMIMLLFLFLVIQKGESHIHDKAGDIISAKCECGFETTMTLGGGWADFKTVCKFPFYCKACSSLTVLNSLSENLTCTICGSEYVMSYDNDSLGANKSNKPIFYWNINDKTYSLTDDFYFCPKCLELKLRFTSVGNGD